MEDENRPTIGPYRKCYFQVQSTDIIMIVAVEMSARPHCEKSRSRVSRLTLSMSNKIACTMSLVNQRTKHASCNAACGTRYAGHRWLILSKVTTLVKWPFFHVTHFEAKWLHRKNKKTQKEQHRRHDQTRRSKEQVRSGIDVMRRVAEEMNADLKHQNERTNRINEKAQRNVEKLRSVNSLLNKDLWVLLSCWNTAWTNL